ncbi:MAG: 23S rRNA (adenine(2030)-N(6))-methyltransferase RlmJ [Pseudomonadota bacterium]
MLSYQHSYHAGGPADVHKHIALAELLMLLTGKDRGISYIETHAGRGLYDLGSEETAKTGEAAEGIDCLDLDPATPFGGALADVRCKHGAKAYPGSPMVAASLLRPQDRLLLMEKHPQELAALKQAMKGTGAEVHGRDGYEGALALTPPLPRRGLVLIDPSYERKDEYLAAGDLAVTLHARWPEAALLIWYPILKAGRHEALIARVSLLHTIRHEARFNLKGGQGMLGSGLLLVGAPYGSDEALARVMKQGAPVLRGGPPC